MRPPRSADSAAVPGERTILLLVGAVQFVNILDFMMIAPLGPRLSLALDMPESQLPDAIAAYTFAAAISGLASASLLDRFDRRPALVLAVLGLVIGTAAGGLANSFTELIAARMLAGLFGGPATSIAISIISDVIPPQRRGRAMGAVMGAFAAASVLGVPTGIALAEVGGWRTPFFAVAGMGVIVAVAARVLLPSLRGHMDAAANTPQSTLVQMLTRPVVLASYVMTFTVNAGAFVLLPNIATYVQNNLGLPESQLKYMYLVGGIVSFFTTRITGILVDRLGALRLATFGTLAFVLVTYAGFVDPSLLPLDTHFYACMYGVFMAFMFANGIRNVAYTTLTTRVPAPNERARFMSIQSAIQHSAAAVGAWSSARLLDVGPDHELVGMSTIAWVSVSLALVLPFLVRRVIVRLGQDA